MRKPFIFFPAIILFSTVIFNGGITAERKTLEIGVSAPDFSLPATDGNTYSLYDFKESDILTMVFTCNHCPTAQAYEDDIMQLVKDYKDKGVGFVAISPNDPLAVRLDELGYSDLGDSFEDMKIRAEHYGYTLPYLYDGENQQVTEAYGPVATPHVFIFDAKRLLRYTGRIDNNERAGKATVFDTRNALDALLAGKAVPVEKTKTFGCSIKWAEKRQSAVDAVERWNAEPVILNTIEESGIKSVLKNETDNLILVNVWATWCGPCVAEFPELVTINRMYRNREFTLISLSADAPDKNDKVLQFLNKQHASFTNYIFNSDDKYKLIEIVDPKWQGSLPYTMIIEPGGKVRYRKMGLIDPLEVKREIVSYLGRYYK
jgi:peroxiredoxin